METIGIIVAMSAEFRLVENLLDAKSRTEAGGFTFLQGEIGGRNVVLAQSGIGKVCAAVCVAEMIRGFHPGIIINSGVAGGISPELRVMDIVAGSRTVYHDVWCGEGNQWGQVQGMPAEYEPHAGAYRVAVGLPGVRGGLICSGDQFITDRTTLGEIRKKFPQGLAVDMESAAMAQVCYIYGVPFLSLRVISDTPGETDDHAAQYRDFWTEAPAKTFETLQQLIKQI